MHNFYYSVDDNVGRFHSNLTNIKKELRNYITYDDQKLVNIDIKNSQPFFSTLLFNTAFYEEESENISLYDIPTVFSLLTKYIKSIEFTDLIIMLGKTVKKLDIKGI
jgi:hypothetical protein